MMLGGACVGSSALASSTPLSTALVDPQTLFPLTVLHRNVHVAPAPVSLTIDETQGASVSASCVFLNPAIVPVAGDPFEVRYFAHVLFSGTLEKIDRRITKTQGRIAYHCTAVDWSQVLARRKVRRRFTDLPISTLVTSLLDNEASGEGFRFGSTDQQSLMELVDADNMSVLEVLREAAGIGGQVLQVEFDKVLYFRATSNPSAPISLTGDTVQSATVEEDRESYRNVQTVIAKGTPPDGSSEKAIELSVTLDNPAQIADRSAIEGGTGRYEQIDTVTHPTSNTQKIVARLANAYATLLLAIGGTPRQTLKARVRGYGFRAGQAASVNLPEHGVTGTWLIQRVNIREEAGRRLVHDLELVQSSLQQRSASVWATILRKGRLIISVPGSALSANVANFTTPGTYQWISPITGTITITTMGGSGGGGGAARITCGSNTYYSKGGKGGNSGKTVSSVTVAVGDVLDIVVGANGPGGNAGSGVCVSDRVGVVGTAGTTSTVSRTGVLLSRAYDGGGGGRGHAYDPAPGSEIIFGCVAQAAGAAGSAGGGSDGVVTTGGGKTGGNAGNAGCSAGAAAGSAGQDGSVLIEY